jgi:hypothetical protein
MSDFRETMSAACFSANGNLMRWEDAPEKLRDGWRAVADEVIAALPDSLDAAWAEAEAALALWPGIALDLVRASDRKQYLAWCSDPVDGTRPVWRFEADTPAAALRALAAKLRDGRHLLTPRMG